MREKLKKKRKVDAELKQIQNILGYTFSDESLVDEAFSHSSYVNEHGGRSNERLEFIGDCVLNFCVGKKLFFADTGANEGELSSHRAALVSRKPLARLVDGLGLIKYLKVGAGVNIGSFSDKARSNLYESIVGAIYLDGGLDACEAFLCRTFYDAVQPERDYKSELQECAVKSGVSPDYETYSEGGRFFTTVTVGSVTANGVGCTKHESQIAAARAALEAM